MTIARSDQSSIITTITIAITAYSRTMAASSPIEYRGTGYLLQQAL